MINVTVANNGTSALTNYVLLLTLHPFSLNITLVGHGPVIFTPWNAISSITPARPLTT